MKRILGIASILAGAPFVLQAQTAWVQVEAERTRTEAEARATHYTNLIPDVAGFSLGSGWYAITLGPYDDAEAQQVLNRLRAQGLIPGDSYIVSSQSYREQFWPAAGTTPRPQVVAPPAPDPQAPDETAQQARASEAQLSREDKQLLQTALAWAGYYSGAIDGLYGRGTRNSMGAWQVAQGYPETGILTTRQRAELIAAYNAVLDGMDLTRVESTQTGIALDLPLGVVAFDRFDPPFAIYGPTGDLAAQVLLISQQGDAQRMAGLYQIMQTLEIVPEDGPRSLRRDGFTLEGADDSRHSYTEVHMVGDQIKGFTLVWPAGDETRRARVLDVMRGSFERLEGVLDPAIAPPSDAQSADLVSGLQIRQPRQTRSGMFIDASGTVLTSAEAVASCGSIEIGGGGPATITHLDADLGIAVLAPERSISPAAFARFSTQTPRLNSPAILAGFPYDGVLPRAALTFGTLADLRDLDGDERISRLTLSATASEAGAPVLNQSGAVIGMLRAADTGKLMPQGVAFALESATLAETLAAVGITLTPAQPDTAQMDAVALTELGAQIAVPVRCWE